MKRIASSVTIFALCFLLLSTTHTEEIIVLPITIKQGYGNLPAGFRRLRLKERTDTLWLKTQEKITGVPKEWTTYACNEIQLNIWQYIYQNYKLGRLTETEFNEWEIDITKRPYSAEPINCFFYVIIGKDKFDKIKYKVDTDHDFDFADEQEMNPPYLTGKSVNFDSIARAQNITVQYQDYRNNKITPLSIPVLVIQTDQVILINFAEHGEVVLDGHVIKIAPDGFISTMYNEIALAVDPPKGMNPTELVKQNEYFIVNGTRYKNLGVDPNKQVLRLQQLDHNDVVYSSQTGFHATPFTAKEFSTQQDVSLKDYAGKFVFIEFWGTWCSPCRAELPNLKQVYSKLDHSKIEFLGIARDEADALKKFLEKEPILWKQIRCESDKKGILADYNINAFPTSFLIDPNGKIIAKDLRGENLSDTLTYYLDQY